MPIWWKHFHMCRSWAKSRFLLRMALKHNFHDSNDACSLERNAKPPSSSLFPARELNKWWNIRVIYWCNLPALCATLRLKSKLSTRTLANELKPEFPLQLGDAFEEFCIRSRHFISKSIRLVLQRSWASVLRGPLTCSFCGLVSQLYPERPLEESLSISEYSNVLQ